ncbi:Nucleoporin NUP82 [Fulvia fulva]|uniref:Nucleoporin NUP82 n=1 Tax=Passalora fulva TaxID=5499 RepID=A0A9Q8P9A1_PASFU|nr:Nucleoporin NUP82 [Fulvia fulva]KAK4624124.1 Nucleoporin NUP82 [Fulvia fulva]KAK4625143.1 Nucleoporin NUP82 [Fulvia fulva]UJO17837.1 Nucleoporin NUP82 [Fulvia fulva]WPV14751.1 Nucleoporin NUP82 [Fulvia fulva]WPV30163.1 Nucleoporin NUP82 [Fulvia fulva]
MAKILAQQPRWLDHGTPGYDFFQPNERHKSAQSDSTADAPLRRVAHRGSEVFVAVGNEIRWSHLSTLQEAGGGSATRHGRQASGQQPIHKVLRTPASRPIQQLSVSPSGHFIAVLTWHTCHVCILPPTEHLRFQDSQPIKLRSYQVGPTAHVLEQASLVSVLWHPLSPSGNALVTVTQDACVRLWELDQNNRSTFNEPALAVDLKKLANASSQREDLSASKYGTNKGFSPDDLEMELASSCFGGQGKDDEDGWSSMTLWVAMTEGDVYALCPFLPSKFIAPVTLLPSLSTSVVAKQKVFDQDRQVSDFDRLVANQQSSWLADLDQQEPTSIPGHYDVDVYSRPDRLSAIPRLQGPFQLSPDPDLGEITDIFAVAPKVNEEAYFDDEDDYDTLSSNDGLSIGIVCLAMSNNKVHICLNVEGVEAEWLPSKRSRAQYMNDLDATKALLLLESAELAAEHQGGNALAWPTFTASPTDRYEVFTTQPGGVFSLSFRPWVTALEDELSAPQPDGEGIGFRLNVIMESASTSVTAVNKSRVPLREINRSIAILDHLDSELGYIVLTLAQSQPLATILDLPVATSHALLPEAQATAGAFAAHVPRAPYHPDPAFDKPIALPDYISKWRQDSARGIGGDIKGQVRFSSDTLQKITKAHQVLSHDTHALGLAAADLYRRCESMMEEMKFQIERVKELSNRVNSVTGEDEFPDQSTAGPELVRGGKDKMEKRIEDRKEKTVAIRERVENLRRKMRNVGGKEMSAKERAFAEEVAKLERTILPEPRVPTSPGALLKMENSELTIRTESEDLDTEERDTIAGRFKAVEDVYKQLTSQAAEVQNELESRQKSATESRPTTPNAHGADFRQQKLAQVFALLDRETALIEAVGERLEKLQVASR